MCGIAEGRITGNDARHAAALIASEQESQGLLDPDETSLDEFIESHGRLFAAGHIGYDEHGGFLSPDVSKIADSIFT